MKARAPEYPPPYLYVVDEDKGDTTLDAWGIEEWMKAGAGEE